MACAQQMQMFDDGDAVFFGDGDLFGSAVPCLAGELELQVQSYEGAGDDPVGDSTAAKSFSLTKDSGGSSLSALAAADFGDPDFMDNVSLDDLAAADHYGHTICGRQSTADSTAGGVSGRYPAAGNPWTGVTSAPSRPHGQAAAAPDRLQGGQESSDCDMSHTHGDGESSGVGPGKSVALGSSHSEASEDNTAGVATGAAARDEEHISTPSYGLSLVRLTHGGGVQGMAVDAGKAQHKEMPSQRERKRQQQQQQQQQEQQQASQQAGQQQQEQQQAATGEQQRAQMPRAFSVDNFALSGAAGMYSGCPDSCADGLRRAHVNRSYSYVAPDTLPMDFSLGWGDSGGQLAFGARGRCASLNETQLRRQWLQEGELLAPRLPPSVSELELLELPEDSFPLRPSSSTGAGLGQSLSTQQQLAGGSLVGSGAKPLETGLMQFKDGSGSSGAGSSVGAATSASAPGVSVTVKRKIITTPSPLLQQPKATKTRHSAAAAATVPAATAKVQSPKRAKLGSMTWQDAAGAPSRAGMLAGWQPQPRQQPGAGAGMASMKTVRSMPANMNSFLDGVEVTVQPLGPSGPANTLISPNSSTASASTSHQGFARGPFFEASAAGSLGGRAAAGAPGATASLPSAPGAKGAKSKATAGGPLQLQGVMPGAGMGGAPVTFMAPGMMVGPDGKRPGPLPSVPKPRKRASPNGNPPKAPAPNPNGHCCTQCGTQTTPVWRAGPHGPKTLCNACGVRYMKVAKGNVPPTPRRQQH